MRLLLSIQTGPDTELLTRVGNSITILAIAAIVIGLGFVGIAIANLAILRSVSRAVRAVEQQVARLGPRAEPLIDNVSRLAVDARGVTGRIRTGVDDLMSTIDDLNRSLREAGEAGRERVREFAAVLDIVKAEAEEILLDSAATARGIHATAEALRGSSSPARRPPPPLEPVEDEEATG